ncbi:hypothetical protein HELRODRAFT_175390 [Helobdella robusta]|uniref:Uncharacterized protein n=1 Tax=Helobdella robusta TaxID=6412 RepID=T1F983_HELRO|nr:hypothetical protein HELRODRAFT_175390 [Helobdella robusta]ESO00894.1 hypothetical protein HELRODRAFT_175390 [Helobdella robusta]
MQKNFRGRCPYEPDSNFTSVYATMRKPIEVSFILSATMFDFGMANSILLRPRLYVSELGNYFQDGGSPIQDGGSPFQDGVDNGGNDEAQFVGTFDIGDFIYVFFRELAHQSGDMGNGENRFTTFVKARLNCSVIKNEVAFRFDEILMQIDVQMCSKHLKCDACTTDPYCGWNLNAALCMPYKEGLLQSMEDENSDLCVKSCQQQSMKTHEATEDSNLYLECKSACNMPNNVNNKVTWQFIDSQSARLIRNDNENQVITQDHGLLLVEVKPHHNAVQPGNRVDQSKESIWRREYLAWCNAYQRYKHCRKENCIPRKITDQCTHLDATWINDDDGGGGDVDTLMDTP